MPFIGRVGRPGLLGLAARTAVVASTATAVSGGMQRGQQRRAQAEYEKAQYEAAQQQFQRETAAAQAAQESVSRQADTATILPTQGVDIASALQQLATLQAQGVLTPDEFDIAKAKLLQ